MLELEVRLRTSKLGAVHPQSSSATDKSRDRADDAVGDLVWSAMGERSTSWGRKSGPITRLIGAEPAAVHIREVYLKTSAAHGAAQDFHSV